MKQFRKNKDGFYICEECGKLCKNQKGLSVHFYKIHQISRKEYYDKWLKEENDDKCKICGNLTEFNSQYMHYKNGCCKKHTDLYVYNIRVKNCLIKYNVENPYQREDVKEKCKKQHLKNLGVENPFQAKTIKDKIKQTRKEKYGNENYKNWKKIKETLYKNYGVENPQQNKEIHEKTLKNAFKLKQFRDTDVWYQGSFELDFLEKYYDIFSDIVRGPTIKYEIDGKNKIYHSDFYIPSLNLIIECKNSWHADIRKFSINVKKKAAITNGFNYIMIIDKNYAQFDTLVPLLKIK